MNKAQRIVLVAGLLVVVAMVVYPPWVITQTSMQRYRWRPIGDTEYRLLTSDASWADGASSFEIDLSRLFLQIFAVGILTAAGYVLVGRRKAGQVEAAEPKDDDTPS